ncbi:tryptophan 2,3-dioxygenase family protein [Rapidithrix thailandica]|uniref:Tryptophan 2,3-dioxygenase family protein n=1 Tax=Rapidithrix thailandica TaxID=413964 RepID=A0AAW9SA74_9BACT
MENEKRKNIDAKIEEQLRKLRSKYDVMGQDMSSYLDGLLYANFLTYWDYIHLDTLLSLQNPKTDFPDEQIFIMYHQITELYFKLILWEIQQCSESPSLEGKIFVGKIKRINRYLKHLVNSFEIMVEGMEKEQFLKFRMTLLPASGFQSVQYRMIEFRATPLRNLLSKEFSETHLSNLPIEETFSYLYWQQGASELKSGKKTLTLIKFEEKYKEPLIQLIHEMQTKNLWSLFLKSVKSGAEEVEAVEALRTMDELMNVQWPLSHYKSAARYLQRDPEVISATGGTNWQKYLPPRFQKIIFFPELWTQSEKKEWGKAYFMKE